MSEGKNVTVISKASFNKAAEATIEKSLAICHQRGNEYSDSWALTNLKTPWLDNLLRDRPMGSIRPDLLPAYKRLIIMASLLDVKLSRLSGDYKEDTAVDSINYIGAYNSMRMEFEEQFKIDPLRAILNGPNYQAQMLQNAPSVGDGSYPLSQLSIPRTGRS